VLGRESIREMRNLGLQSDKWPFIQLPDKFRQLH